MTNLEKLAEEFVDKWCEEEKKNGGRNPNLRFVETFWLSHISEMINEIKGGMNHLKYEGEQAQFKLGFYGAIGHCLEILSKYE